MNQKNYLVVGGSSGIGLELVKKLAENGNQVQVWSRHEGLLAGMAGVTHASVDITADEIPADQLPEVLHGVAYCPGSILLKPFRTISADQFRQDLEINLIGGVRTLQAAERKLKRAEQASVVLFSTVAVGRGMSFHASVASAKGAVEGLTRALAAEWAPQIRVNAIAPSLTDTPMAERLLNTPEKQKASAERHPLKRFGHPEEIAQLAYYLLDESSGWITGQVIGIDGGMSAL